MARDVIQLALRLKDDATPGLKRVGGAAENAGNQAEQAGKKFRISKKAMMGLAAAAGGVAVGLGAMIKGLTDAQNLLTDTATRTGLTTQTLAGLKLAAEGSGLQFEALSAGLTQFPKRMADMARNTGGAKVAFEALGMSVTNADGSLRAADDVMKEALTRLNGVESATDKAALATQLFGRSGTMLLQAMSGTELEDFVQEAEKFGLKIGPNAAKAAGDLQREIARLTLVTDRSKQMFLEAFGGRGGASGAVKGFGATLIGTVTAFRAMMDNGRKAFGTIAGAVTDLLVLIGGLGSAVANVFSGDFTAASRAADKALASYRVGLQTTAQEAMELLETGGILGAIKKGVEAGRAAFEAPTAGAGAGRAPGARTQLAAVGEDAKASEDAQKAIEAQQKAFDAAAKAFSSQMERMQAALMGPQTKSQKMEAALVKLTESFTVAQSEAAKLGTTSSKEFRAMAAEYDSTAKQMRQAIDEQRAAEVKAAKDAAKQAKREGATSAISGAFGMATGGAQAALSQAGAPGAILAGLAELGEMGAERIELMLSALVENLITGLVEVLPDLLVSIPEMLIDMLPELLAAVMESIPRHLIASFVQLPIAIVKGAGMALAEIWEKMKSWLGKQFKKLHPMNIAKGIGSSIASGLKSVGSAIGSVFGFQTGGVVRNTGLHMLHAGERIVPTSGASTQAVFAGAENINSGQAINISTNVVDPNAIDGLARMLQREVGSFGGGRDLSIFNVPAATAG